jgi:hypothetical protein
LSQLGQAGRELTRKLVVVERVSSERRLARRLRTRSPLRQSNVFGEIGPTRPSPGGRKPYTWSDWEKQADWDVFRYTWSG